MSKVKFYFVGLIFFVLFCIPLPEFSISYSLVCKIFPFIGKSYVVQSQNDESSIQSQQSQRSQNKIRNKNNATQATQSNKNKKNPENSENLQNSEKKHTKKNTKQFQLNNTRYKFDYIKIKKKFFDNVVIKFHEVKILHNVISSKNMNVYSKNLQSMMNMLENHQKHKSSSENKLSTKNKSSIENGLSSENRLSKALHLSKSNVAFVNKNYSGFGVENDLSHKHDIAKKMKKIEKKLEARLMRYNDNLHDSSYCIEVKNLHAGFSIVKILSYILTKKNNFSSMKNAIHEVDCEEIKVSKVSGLRNTSMTNASTTINVSRETSTSRKSENARNSQNAQNSQKTPTDHRINQQTSTAHRANQKVATNQKNQGVEKSDRQFVLKKFSYKTQLIPFDKKFGFAVYFVLNNENYLIKGLHYDHAIDLQLSIHNVPVLYVYYDFLNHIFSSKFGFKKLYDHEVYLANGMLNFSPDSVNCDFNLRINNFSIRAECQNNLSNFKSYRIDDFLSQRNELKKDYLKRSRFHSTVASFGGERNFGALNSEKDVNKKNLLEKELSEKELGAKGLDEKNHEASSDTIYLLLNVRNLSFTDAIKYLFDKDHFLLPIAVLFFDKLIDLSDGVVKNVNFDYCKALIVFDRPQEVAEVGQEHFQEARSSKITEKAQSETDTSAAKNHTQNNTKNNTKNYSQNSGNKLSVSDFFVEYKNLIIDLSFDGLDVGYLKGSGHFDTNTFFHEMDYAELNGFAIGSGFVKMTNIDWFAFRDSMIEVSSEIITKNVISIISTFVKDEKLKRFLSRLGGSPMSLSFLGNLTQENGLVFWIGANLNTFMLRNEFIFEDFIEFKNVEIICELDNHFYKEYREFYDGFGTDAQGVYGGYQKDFRGDFRSDFLGDFLGDFQDESDLHKNLEKNLENKKSRPKMLSIKGRGNNFFFESVEKLKTNSTQDLEKNSRKDSCSKKDPVKKSQKNDVKYETFFETVVKLIITPVDLYNLGINLTNYLDTQSILDVEVRHCDRNSDNDSNEKCYQKEDDQQERDQQYGMQQGEALQEGDQKRISSNANTENPWQIFVNLKDSRVYISPMNYYKDFGKDLYVQFSSVDFLFIDDFKIFTFMKGSPNGLANSSANSVGDNSGENAKRNAADKVPFIIASGSMRLNKYSDLMEMHLKTFYFKNAYYKLSEKAEITALNYCAIGIDFKMKNVFNNRCSSAEDCKLNADDRGLNVEDRTLNIEDSTSNVEHIVSNVEGQTLNVEDSTSSIDSNESKNNDEILGDELLSNGYDISIEVNEFSLDELIHDLMYEKHDKQFNPAVKSLLKVRPVRTVNYIKIHLPKSHKGIYTDFTFKRRMSKNNSQNNRNKNDSIGNPKNSIKNNFKNIHEYLIAMLAEKITLFNTILTFVIQYNVDGSIGLNNFYGTGRFFHEFKFHDDFIDLKNIDNKYSGMSKSLRNQIKKHHIKTEKYISNMVKYYDKSKESSMFLSFDKDTNIINMFFDNAGVVLRFFGVSKAFLNGIMSINFDINHVNEFLSSLSKNAPKLNLNKPHVNKSDLNKPGVKDSKLNKVPMNESSPNNKSQSQESQQSKSQQGKSHHGKLKRGQVQQYKVQRNKIRTNKNHENNIHKNNNHKNKMFYFPVHVKILDANMEIKKSNFFFKILYSGLSLFMIKRMFDKFFSVDLNTFVMLSNKEILVKSFYINLLDICITGEGIVNFQEKTIVNWSGEIMPFYYLSKIVNLLYIKPFNDIINPDGHGIISMKYFADGNIKSPNIKVNPLSIFLFRGFK